MKIEDIRGRIIGNIATRLSDSWAASRFTNPNIIEVGKHDNPPEFLVYVEEIHGPKDTNEYEWAVSHRLYGMHAVGKGAMGKRLAIALWRSDSLYVGLHVRRVTEWEDGKP